MERKSESQSETTLFHPIGRDGGHYSWPDIPRVLLLPDVDVRRAKLAEVIADHIVPRLHNLHQDIRAEPVAGAIPRDDEIAEFGALVMASEIGAASVYFDAMRAKGHSLDTLFVHFLEPTARYLGELWEQDRCDFIDVTLGVAHLQELLSVFGSQDDIPVRDSDHRALLLTTPGEKHVFGVEMVARFMRGAGWDVTSSHGVGPKEGVRLVANDWYGVVGLTLSAEAGLETTARLIEEIRRASINPTIRVMVGGPLFLREPDRVTQVGADAAARDAPSAVVLAKKLLLSRAAA